MNFAQIRQCKGQKDDKNYDLKISMFAVFNEIGGISFTQNQKQTCKVELADDTGEAHTVHLYGKYLPDASRLNQRSAFLISAFDGTIQGGQPYVGYSGFWQSGNQGQTQQQAQQPAPQQRQQAPQQARQSTNAPNTTNISIERQCAWKAACNVAAATSTMAFKDIEQLAVRGLSFIQFGKPIDKGGQTNPDYVGDDPPPPDDSDVPF